MRNFFKIGSTGLAALAALAIACAMLVLPSGAQAQQCTPTGTDQTCTNSISLSGGTFGLSDNGTNTLTVTNTVSGTISGSVNGISADNNANVGNAGTILGSGGNGVGANGTANVTNSGSIISAGENGISAATATVTNSGTISTTAAGGNGIFANNNATVINSGLISTGGAGSFGIFANNATVGNSGTISGGLDGIVANTNANVSNAGNIFGGTGIFANTNANVTNSGTISSNAMSGSGISANNNITVTNSGTISATGAGSDGIFALKNAAVTNSGTISGDLSGIEGDNNAAVSNSGTISAIRTNGSGIFTSGNATVTNSGTISANGMDGTGISAGTANVTNSGTISANGASGAGISADTVTVTNSGTISANGMNGEGINAFTATVVNSGAISARGFGIVASTAIVTNSGTIQGSTGIFANGSGSTLVNSGTIIGTAGTAINFSQSSNDQLTFLPGSRITGSILLGTDDAVNVVTGRGLSSMLTFTPNGVFSLTASGSAPVVVSGNSVASLDPTAFGMADRAMMDLTQGVSSLVEGRFGGMAPVGAGAGTLGAGALGFAPTTNGVADSANAAFGSIPSLAIAYAPDAPDAPGYLKAPAAGLPGVGVTTVWTGAFGGIRNQRADGAMLAATDTAVGASIGIDRRVAPNLWLGGFVGGGSGRISVDLNSQTVNTDYVFGGGYGRYEWNSQFVNFMLYGGHTSNSSSRMVTNNLAPNGLENATAHYDGWFLSPDVTWGLNYAVGNGYVLTPTARLRYVAGILDGYSETGSAQNLQVGNRTLQDLEQRLELNLDKIYAVGAGTLKTDLYGGAIGVERLGDTNVNTVLLGQNLTFVTPGHSTEFGGLAGGSFDFSTLAHVSLFGAVEGIWLNDNATIVTAKGGIRGTF